MASRADACVRVGVLAVAASAVLGVARANPDAQAGPPPRYHEALTGTLVRFEMRLVAGGDIEAPDRTGGVRRVRVDPFYLGVTEVTWDMYDVFALGLDLAQGRGGADAIARPSNPYGAPDYGWGHAGFPAMSVTRNAAEAFCRWLSTKTGRAYRLPTEAEWLRAAALAIGEVPLSPDRRDALAWHAGNSGGRTHAVATTRPDALGLFDLFGNVGEWVTSEDDALVQRGGTFRDPAEFLGLSARRVQDPSWNETDPQLPKSSWWLSDAPFAGLRLARSVK